MKKIVFYLLSLIPTMMNAQNIPQVTSGSIKRIEAFESKFIDERIVDIWLPKNYNSNKKYAVLYMQDGQMLFDATTTWNKQAWDAEEVATQLINDNKVQEFIIVGIWNGGKVRHASYFPQRPYENLSLEQKAFVTKKLQEAGRTTEVFVPNSDNYLKFLVQELKPFIDKNYSVFTDAKHTFIAGSSMGALISMYAVCEYPNVFAGAACLSTHWPGIFSVENNPIPDAFFNYLKTNLPDPATHKIYFDYGDQTLDALYPELQKKADQVMTEKGYTARNWMTQFFTGKDHSEKSWNERLHIPFKFLLKE